MPCGSFHRQFMYPMAYGHLAYREGMIQERKMKAVLAFRPTFRRHILSFLPYSSY